MVKAIELRLATDELPAAAAIVEMTNPCEDRLARMLRASSGLSVLVSVGMTSGAVTVTVTTATPPSAPDVPTAEVEVDIAEVGRATVPFAFLSAAALMPAALNSESAFASLVQVSIWT